MAARLIFLLLEFKGAVSWQSSSFCLILPITHAPSIGMELKISKEIYMEKAKSEIRDKQIYVS